MASNNTNPANSGGNGSRDDTIALNLTYSALAVSVVALIFSTLQALLAYLQFDNSEVGRRRCSAEVMGELWAGKTRRKFKWREWRYQVFFEVPVFYTAPPSITLGPLTKLKPKARLIDRFLPYPEADDKENSETFQDEAIPKECIELQKHVQPIYKITGTETSCKYTMTKFIHKDEKWANVHTAEDEGCSWVFLLDALQAQEKASRAWDNTSERGLNHTICCLIQRKERCWDFMPLNVTKPFATTNICHLVEMMSMLGLIWKEFDIKRSSLNGEGNGYMVKTEYVPGLGILARFSRLGKAEHRANRVIPCEELKSLCFGEVPSLFDSAKEKPLQVGPERLDQCLKRLLPRLADTDRRLFSDASARPPRPLTFPLTFELIAMLAKSVHIPKSRFRRLPNPCAENWTSGLDMAACLDAFGGQVMNSTAIKGHILTAEIQELFRNGRMDALNLTNGQTLGQKIKAYSVAAAKLEDEKAEKVYCPEENRPAMKEKASREYGIRLLDLLDNLHWSVERVDERLRELVDKPVFRGVVALHISAILAQQDALNTELAERPRSASIEGPLVDFYFDNIYPAVVQGPPEGQEGAWSEQTSRSATTTLHSSEASMSTSPNMSMNMSMSSSKSTLPATASATEQRSDIWLGLMFRMWAWLFIHDFHPDDKMIERSEFKDNRLPIYIG